MTVPKSNRALGPGLPTTRRLRFPLGAEPDRQTVAAVIEGVGLRPVYVGPDEEAIVDCLSRLWVALAIKQGQVADSLSAC